MEILDIYFKVKDLESKNIYLLLEQRGVNIFHTPRLFGCNDSKGRIITDIFGNTSIFLRFNSGEQPDLERFILWHELGHLETEGITFRPRSFDPMTFRERDESDPNVFAIFGILHWMNDPSIAPVDLADQLGIPFPIVMNCYNRIRQDEEFMAYIHREKCHD